MTSVTLPVDRGGDGNTYDDTTDPNTGLDNYGYVTRWMKLIAAVMGVANWIKTQADLCASYVTAAASSASSALNAPGTSATSTTSLAISIAVKTLTLAQTGKAYSAGQTVVIASTASPGNQMTGVITSFTAGSGAMQVDVQQILGSGTFAAWTIALSAVVVSGLPSQAGANLKVLGSNGTSASWVAAVVPANNGSDFTNMATFRTNVGLAIGSNVQAFHANLSAFAGLTLVADRLPYATGAGTLGLTTFTAFARTLLDDTDAVSMRGTIGAQASHANLTAFAGVTGAADKFFYFTAAGAGSLATVTAFARTLLDDVDADTARATLVAAKRGQNADITELTGLLVALSVAQGGTGVTTLAALLSALIPVTALSGGLTGEFSLGGVRFKWGQTSLTGKTSGTAGENTVNFVAQGLTAFTTVCAGAWVIPDQPSGGIGGTNYPAYVRGLSAAGFTAGLDSTGTPDNTYTCYWFAIGI